MHHLIFLLGLFVVSAYALQTICPHPEESYPCYCEEDEDRTVMHCNNLNENKQIVQALSPLTDYSLYTVSIWLFDTDTIKSDAFKGPKIREISFQHSTVITETPQFLGQEDSLLRVSFLNSFDEEDFMGTWSLGHLKKLKELTFEKGEIEVVKNDWLISVPESLRSITFDECKIQKLEDKILANIPTLTTIFLMNNLFTTVSRSMFPKSAEDLRSINLSGNKIASLPDDLFDNMPSLISVDLERNQITTMSQSLWGSKLEKFTRIYLEDNPINCDSNMKWISKKSLPRSFTGKCSSPSKLKGKDLKSLTPADFH